MERSLLFLCFLCLTSCASSQASETRESTMVRQTLIDVDQNLKIPTWGVDSESINLETSQRWRVHKYVLHGGRQEGVDMLLVDNGRLSFKVAPTRGMNLWQAECEGLRLGWDSPVTEVVHPQFVNLNARGGLGWLEGFGEWISRCGLESNGAPGRDEIVNNTGEIVSVDLTLHGKVSYIPARKLEVVIEPPPSRMIRVRGVVDETMVFGPRLRLITEISTEVGSTRLTIRDEVQNLATTPQEMQLLYHCNFGRPLLEKGARLVVPVKRVTPRDQRATDGGMSNWNRYGPPQSGYVEQVYFLDLAADAEGQTEALLQNADGSRGASLQFSLKQLPYMTLWKNTSAEADGYVTGLEPATNYPNLRSTERKHGRVPLLEGGESYHTRLDIIAHLSPKEVKTARERIHTLQGKPPIIDEDPQE